MTAVQTKSVSLVKTASPLTYSAVGDVIMQLRRQEHRQRDPVGR